MEQKLCCLVNPVTTCVYCRQYLCKDCTNYVGNKPPCTKRKTKIGDNGHWLRYGVRYTWGKYERQPVSGMFR